MADINEKRLSSTGTCAQETSLKVFVTGATGFIGRHLVKRLIKEDYEVVCSGRSLQRLGPLLKKTKALYLDIKDKEAAKVVIDQERPDIVFHCAAEVTNTSLKKLWQANVEGTKNILNACLYAGVKKVVYLSSISAISGNPKTPLPEDSPYSATNNYGLSKLEAEKAAIRFRKRGLKVAIIRPVMVYGEDEPHLLPLLINLIKWRALPIIGKGDNRLQLVDVENVVDVMMFAFSKEELFEGNYTIADKEALTIKELFSYIGGIVNAPAPIHIPEVFIPFLTRLPIIGRKFSFILKDRAYRIDNIENRLGYTPRISVYDGLKKSILALSKKIPRL